MNIWHDHKALIADFTRAISGWAILIPPDQPDKQTTVVGLLERLKEKK